MHRVRFDVIRNVVMTDFASMLAALGQEARLQIFRRVVRAGPDGCCVDDIRRHVGIPGSTLSHHLDTLSRCGLLAAARRGRFIFYAVNWERTAALLRFLTEDCCTDLRSGKAVCGTAPRPAPRRAGQRSARKGARP